ncbi:MAG: hypothetical protein AAB628_01025 [Patescibacteria group bacterium]
MEPKLEQPQTIETREDYARYEQEEKDLRKDRNEEGEKRMTEEQKKMSEERTWGTDDPKYFESAVLKIWNGFAINKDGELFIHTDIDALPKIPAPLYYGVEGKFGIGTQMVFARVEGRIRTEQAKNILNFKDAPEWLREVARRDLKETEIKS